MKRAAIRPQGASLMSMAEVRVHIGGQRKRLSSVDWPGWVQPLRLGWRLRGWVAEDGQLLPIRILDGCTGPLPLPVRDGSAPCEGLGSELLDRVFLGRFTDALRTKT